MFKSVNGKMGNMRKSVSWVVCPVSTAEEGIVYIQSDKRIAKIDTKSGKAILSASHNYPTFQTLYMDSAKEVDCPEDILKQLGGVESKSGEVRIL